MKRIFPALNGLTLLVSSILVVSCSGSGEPQEDGVPLVISAEIQTRVSGGSWDANDQIGVFMTDAAVSTSVIGNQYNKLYVTDGSGKFSAVGQQEIYFPGDDRQVKVRAYYPYAPLVYEDMLVPLYVGIQAEAPVDFMTATSASVLTKDTPQARLQFYHRLTKLFFTIRSDYNISELAGTELLIEGMDTRAVYDLVEEKLTTSPSQVIFAAHPVSVNSVSDSAELSFSAVIFPRAAGSGAYIVLKLPDGNLRTCPINGNLELKEGVAYNFLMSFTADKGLEVLSVDTGAW